MFIQTGQTYDCIIICTREELQAIRAAVEITYSDLTSVPEELREVGKNIYRMLQP